MYRKIVWCYVFILTLLDISLNTKLSAQGKSHGVTVHDSLIEGITFQEWGKESVSSEGAGGAGGAGGGRAVSAGALALSPPALDFGRAALAAAHALTVTLTNTANTTMHLASVAGTTPDFHASFFESKTLLPQANTTFSVVYLGRREGPVSAHLYIHTSLGVHKYPVSAVGVASEWGVWPLVGVRVPLNATVEPLLTMHNPTDHTIQVSEVYSSGAWLGLQLPDGGASAPRAVWSLPPRATRPLVRLRLTPHTHTHAAHAAHATHATHAAQQHTLTAYIRIKANITGGGLVVCVEARATPAGEYASPLELRLMTRGSRDPADVLDISLGNSAGAGVALDASVWAARCAHAPNTPPAPHTHTHGSSPTHNGETKGTANGNGVKSEGVYVSLVRSHLEPHQQLTRAAQLTFDYARMWAGYGGGTDGSMGGAGDGAWCGGWVELGRAALPYSVRLLPGTLRLDPTSAHFVTANKEEALTPREIRAHNEFSVPVHISQIDLGPDVDKYFEVESKAPLVIAPSSSAVVGVVRLRTAGLGESLRAHVTLRTNASHYELPLLLYSGTLDVQWQWRGAEGGELRLGALGASSTRRVRALLHNRGVVTLCVSELRAALPGAQLTLAACGSASPPPEHACRCIAAGASAAATLTVVAPAREGPLRGHVVVSAAPEGRAAPPPLRLPVELAAHHGRLHAHQLALLKAAPYVWASSPLVLESTMALAMRVLDVELPADNPALSYQAGAEESVEVSAGRHAVGAVWFAPERLCHPHCYTGLDVHTPEGSAWLGRSDVSEAERFSALEADGRLLAARYALYAAAPARSNISLQVHTTRVLHVAVTGATGGLWPRLAPPAPPAGLAPVGGAASMRLRAHNPAATPVLLQPVIAGELPELSVSADSPQCRGASCVWAPRAFRLLEWRTIRGSVTPWARWDPASTDPADASAIDPEGADTTSHNATDALPMLVLAPGAEIELKLSFAPREPAPLTAYLYLRNNLTILEAIQLAGRGAYPSFEIGGRRPGTNAPLLFEVSDCGSVGAGGTGGGTVVRTVVARNTGRVRVRLREWRVAGEPCGARGFRLLECAPLVLAPNESRALTLAFTADWTLARVTAPLELRWELGRAAFVLRAAAPARLLPRCAAHAPRPAWEPALRAIGAALAIAALALVLAAAALDAERELRRARAARPTPPPQPAAPLDLRALAVVPQAPPPPVPRRAPARRRRAPRTTVDPAAERRAFERWRHDVLRRPDDDDERSSEDNEAAPSAPAPPPPPAPDGYDADPESEERRAGSGDDDNASTDRSASSSSPTADVDEPDDEPPPAGPAPGADAPPARARAPPPDAAARPVRPRRDPSEPPRRGERARAADGAEVARPRPAAAKHHARKDKAKRRERPPASPPRSPPLRADCRAPGALRWGASWSSVVAARAGSAAAARPAGPAPLAPIGSDVRRRADPAPADHSLFYFNGDPSHTPPRDPADFAWRPPPPVERPTFSPSRDFLDEPAGVGNGSFRSLNSVWGSGLEPRPAAAAWLWGGLGVRPPPGFGAPAAARGVRPYDPFRSLASIWAPGALDWRAAAPGGPAPPAAAAPDEPAAPH